MNRKIVYLLLLLGTLWLTSCAADSSLSKRFKYSPGSLYSHQDVCGMGAVYCGPGP